MSRGRIRVAALIALGAVALPLAALAAHGKAGLWEVISTVNMPNMPQISPAQMAQMQAMGAHMPSGHSVTVQTCMTAAEVASDSPPRMHSKSCTMSNVKMEGQTLSGTMTCTGEFEGTGNFAVTYDGDEHYSGTNTIAGTANGHPMNSSSNFDGKWISADCGSVK